MPFPDVTGWVPDQQLAGIGTDFAARIDEIRMQQAMTGQQPIPEYSPDQTPQQYLMLLAPQDYAMARTISAENGWDVDQLMREAEASGYYQAGTGSNIFNSIGNLTRVGRGEVTGFGDFARDAALLGAIGYGTGQLGGGQAGASVPAGAEVAPNGLLTGSASAAGGGVGTLSGAVPAVGASPGLAAGLGVAGAAVGPNGLPTGPASAAGGGVGTMSGGVPAVGAGTVGNALSNIPSWVNDYLLPGVNALLGYNAADNASDAMAGAYDRAIEEQRRQYDTTRADLMPWLTAGQGALSNLQNPNAFQASPGYEWARNEGIRDIGNSFAARGGAASGNALRALSEYQTGLAQQDYNNWWNRQAGVAGVGQNTAVNLGGIGANAANVAGNYLADRGVARASGVLGRNAAVAGGLNDAAYNWLARRRTA